jgi:hypothetical protein
MIVLQLYVSRATFLIFGNVIILCTSFMKLYIGLLLEQVLSETAAFDIICKNYTLLFIYELFD